MCDRSTIKPIRGFPVYDTLRYIGLLIELLKIIPYKIISAYWLTKYQEIEKLKYSRLKEYKRKVFTTGISFSPLICYLYALDLLTTMSRKFIYMDGFWQIEIMKWKSQKTRFCRGSEYIETATTKWRENRAYALPGSLEKTNVIADVCKL